MKILLLILTMLIAAPCFAEQAVYRDRHGNTVGTRERQGNEFVYRDRYGNTTGTERYESGRKVYRDRFGNVEYTEDR